MDPKTIFIQVQPADRTKPPELRPVLVSEETLGMDLVQMLGLKKGDGISLVQPKAD